MLTHDTPNIVASNHVAQVKRQPRTSWTESRVRSILLRKQDSLHKGYLFVFTLNTGSKTLRDLARLKG